MKNAQLNTLHTIEDYFTPPDIHDLEREKQGGGIPTFLVSAVVLFVEWLIARYVVEGHPMGLLWHALVVLILAIATYVVGVVGRESRFMLLLLIGVSATGPFGAAGTMLTIITYLWFTQTAVSFNDWFDSIFPRIGRTHAEQIHHDIEIGRDESATYYSVIPFLDVVSFGSEAQKRAALGKMTANFNPGFAPAFKKALSDKSNTIRVLAATGISRIETHFLERLMALSDVKKAHPDDPQIIWALAEHYDNYAYTGLLDVTREASNRKQALEYYHKYLEMEPNDARARSRIGRILIRNKDYDKAALWLRQCIDQGHNSPTVNEWYAEALFATGRYAELRRFRAAQPKMATEGVSYNPAMQEALNLWSGGRV